MDALHIILATFFISYQWSESAECNRSPNAPFVSEMCASCLACLTTHLLLPLVFTKEPSGTLETGLFPC